MSDRTKPIRIDETPEPLVKPDRLWHTHVGPPTERCGRCGSLASRHPSEADLLVSMAEAADRAVPHYGIKVPGEPGRYRTPRPEGYRTPAKVRP